MTMKIADKKQNSRNFKVSPSFKSCVQFDLKIAMASNASSV